MTCRVPGTGPYREIAREGRTDALGEDATRIVEVRGIPFGGPEPVIIAGPCAVETREQTLEVAHAVRAVGGDLLRGGAYKPRTSPYDFQGLREEGLQILAEAREQTGLPIVTEVLDVRDIEIVAEYADVLQIGARNMQHFPLLIEAGKAQMPVLLKRHWAATMDEWLGAAEYIAAQGNLDILLCERGIRSFTQGTYNRSTLDVNIIPAVKRLTFLPVIVDPSHATGDDELVPGASRAGIAAGGDGLIIEVLAEDADPAQALCDGHQSIKPSVLDEIIRAVRPGGASWSTLRVAGNDG